MSEKKPHSTQPALRTTFLVFWRQLDALVLAAGRGHHLGRAEDLAEVDLEDVAQLLVGEGLLLPLRFLCVYSS